MIQNYLDNTQKNNKVITGLIVFAITFFLSLSIFNFLNSNFSNDVSNEYCKNFVNPVIKYQDEIEIINNDIYIFPEIKNLLCINKVTNLEVNNDVKFLTIGTNPKIVNLIISITFLYIFSFRKKISTVFAVYLFFIFGLSYNFFFSINFYSINIVLFFTFLIINNFSINNDESIAFRK